MQSWATPTTEHEMSEWQPIETAPKDGTRVAVKFENGYENEANYQTTYGGEWHVASFRHLPWSKTPAYWMPLPAPPNNQVERQP